MKSKIPLVLNILLGRKRCSCEQINNITGYFREDEQLPRPLKNVVRNFAHLRIFLVTSLVYQPRHSRGTNVLSQCDFCSPAWLFWTTWMASCKGPILYGGPQLSQQNQKPHGKNKNITTKPKTSRQKQNTSRQNQIHHSKSKRALVLLWVFPFTVIWLSKSCRFMIISISAYRFEVLNN